MPSDQELQDRLTRVETRLGLRNNASNLRPFEHEPSIPIPAQLKVLLTSSAAGVTTLVLGWETPDNPEFDTMEFWVKDLSSQAEGIVKVAESREGPATLVLTSDSTSVKTVIGRPRMRNGQGADFTACPTVTAEVVVPSVTPGPNSVTNTMLQRTGADPIQITNLDVVSLEASKILAGTIVGVNISAGTYTLLVGSQQMLINGADGFLQSNTSATRTAQITNGQVSSFRTTSSSRAEMSAGASGGVVTLTNSAGNVALFISGANEGSINMNNSAGTSRLFLGVDGSGNAQITVNGSGAVSGSFTTADAKTVTVTEGIITAIV